MILPSLSIIIPARNEKKYIENIAQRLLSLSFPGGLEIIFIEGHSRDGTLEEIKRVADIFRDKVQIRYHTQEGVGKADAVWKGFDVAKNDILMILDADLTVQPEDLPEFYQATSADSNIFVNGSRFVYPMEKGAMRPLNYLGNRAFAFLLSLVTHQKMTDT